MLADDPDINGLDILPLMLILWICYLAGLALVDHTLYPQAIFPPRYYLLHAIDLLAALGLVLWPGGRRRLGPIFLPLIIVMMALAPLLLAQITTFPQPPGPASSPEGVLLRTMPLLFLGLVLAAWQYGWPAVVLFSAGAALATLGAHALAPRPGGPAQAAPLAAVAIETISFLAVGYFISALIRQLRRQRQALARANARLSDYAAALEDLTISRERNRMARELHDTLAHTLSALSVRLEAVSAYVEVDPPAARRMLDGALAATRSGLQETRRALKALRASPLDDLGALGALRQLAEEAAARAGLRLELELPARLPALPEAVEQCLYRVAQEATANAAQHAAARTLRVALRADGAICLRISDDGRGFAPEQAGATGHFGLAGMRERAQMAGADLTIASRPGEGTVVTLSLGPPKAADRE